MSRIFIIGNGLDLYYGLKTSPKEFIKRIEKKKIYGSLENAKNWFESYGVNWNNLEESLSQFDIEEFLNENLKFPNYLSDFESDRDSGYLEMKLKVKSIKESVNEALCEMVSNANEKNKCKEVYKKGYIRFNNEDKTITFNYTNTIEEMPSFKTNHQIMYIHGNYEKKEELIFGCLKLTEKTRKCLEEDFYIEQQYIIAKNFHKSLLKKMQYVKLIKFLKNEKDIDKIIVLGHSLSKIDKKYFEIIERIIKPKTWEITYHNKKNEIINKIEKYSFAKKVKFIQMKKYIH